MQLFVKLFAYIDTPNRSELSSNKYKVTKSNMSFLNPTCYTYLHRVTMATGIISNQRKL